MHLFIKYDPTKCAINRRTNLGVTLHYITLHVSVFNTVTYEEQNSFYPKEHRIARRIMSSPNVMLIMNVLIKC